jgi:hypothetical protein
MPPVIQSRRRHEAAERRDAEGRRRNSRCAAPAETQRLILAGLLIQSRPFDALRSLRAGSARSGKGGGQLPQGVEHFDSLRRRGKIHAMRWTAYGELRLYSTYILSNTSMTLYIGVTNNLAWRISQHKKGHGSAFTSRYHFDRLVYFEQTPTFAMRSPARRCSRDGVGGGTWSDLSVDWLE